MFHLSRLADWPRIPRTVEYRVEAGSEAGSQHVGPQREVPINVYQARVHDSSTSLSFQSCGLGVPARTTASCPYESQAGGVRCLLLQATSDQMEGFRVHSLPLHPHSPRVLHVAIAPGSAVARREHQVQGGRQAGPRSVAEGRGPLVALLGPGAGASGCGVPIFTVPELRTLGLGVATPSSQSQSFAR